MNETVKRCPGCDEIKPLTDYHKSKKERLGVVTRCKVCISKKTAINREKNAENHKKWREQNAIHLKQYQAQWIAENHTQKKEMDRQYYATNREERKQKQRAWYQANRDKASISGSIRRGQKKNAPGKFTRADIGRLFELQRGHCAICKQKLKPGYHIDHITALSKGGANDFYNLQLLCPFCNLSKHNRDPIEYNQSRGYLL